MAATLLGGMIMNTSSAEKRGMGAKLRLVSTRLSRLRRRLDDFSAPGSGPQPLPGRVAVQGPAWQGYFTLNGMMVAPRPVVVWLERHNGVSLCNERCGNFN